MKIRQLIVRNLWYHRKPYLATLAGVAISTAVLTGALVVGDSVRYSLQQFTEVRLGKAQFAIQANERFFRQVLADSIQALINCQVTPILQSEGIVSRPEMEIRINRAQVIGMDERFTGLWKNTLKPPGPDEAIINANVASKLHLQPGDEFLLRVQKRGKAPQNAPFVAEQSSSASVRLKIIAISDDATMGRFSLKSNQVAPYTVFMSLEQMAAILDLDGYSNLLLVSEDESGSLNADKLENAISKAWTLSDAGFHIRKSINSGMVEMTSDRIFMNSEIADALEATAPGKESFLTYLVNSISIHGNSTPYSFVTAADPEFTGYPLADKEIILNSWLAGDLNAKPGDSVMLRYFLMGPMRSLKEDSCRFRVKAVIDIHDPRFDRNLMPDFPGMTRAGNCREWETGAPVDLKKIRVKDEDYWNEFKGTPKAFLSLNVGQNLFQNPFGSYTSFRFKADSASLPFIEKNLMNQLLPLANGFKVESVVEEGRKAAANSTDFGGLFLSLSFFIIVSGLLLTALLFGLHANSRIPETAVLSTLGFTTRKIIRILLSEALVVAVSGSILGSFAGITYNKLLLWGLNTVWQDAVGTSMLQMHIVPGTLLLGSGIGLLISLLTILLVLFLGFRKRPSTAVKGNISLLSASFPRKLLFSKIIAILCLGSSSTLLFYEVIAAKAINPILSLIAGGGILAGAIATLAYFLYRTYRTTGNTLPGFPTLIFRNLSIRRKRTISAVTLLALGTFSIILTGANRKSFTGAEQNRQSGTGGFLLWAETTIPVNEDLNSPEGKIKYSFADEPLLRDLKFLQIHRVDGDDASCLNLNQVVRPVLLGIQPDIFAQMNVFSFSNLDPLSDKDSPWSTLDRPLAADVLPAFADQTVITWGIRKSVGDTLIYRDEMGNVLKIKLMGGLKNSIFQGNLLISDSLLRKFYPSVAGSKVILVDGPFYKQKEIATRLEFLFRDYGMVATPPSERLDAFNAVENTYLSVFMLLGGLGVMIGGIGLGIILLRNTIERRRELAIYLALGFRKKYIQKLLMYEYIFILIAGIGIGLLASLAGILPSMDSSFSQLPWIQLGCILIIIILSGFLWIYFPARASMKQNLLQSLREE